MTSYLNFELHIIALNEGAYRASVMAAPQDLGGQVPSHSFKPPFDDASLARVLQYLSGQRNPRGESRNDLAKRFGEALFKTVFAGEVLASYQTARRMAEDRNMDLRIRLHLQKAGKLSSFPWEFLRDPQVDYLALSRGTPLVRYTEQLVRRSRFQAQLPLRVLVMISNPANVPEIDEATERQNMERATQKLQAQGLLEIEYLEDASLRELQRMLRQKVFHVFHYIGHGAYNPESNIGTLILEDPYDHSQAYPIRGEALARELHEEETLRLVVLNSCQGASFDNADPFSGVATSLVQRGIPAVVAQQFEISDRAAIIFSEEFYRSVAEGFPIEAAVAEGRRAIASVLDNTEWATPVLFLHDNDSQQIFNLRPPAGNRLRRNLPQVAIIGVMLCLLLFFLLMLAVVEPRRNTAVSLSPPTPTPIPNVDLVVRDIRLSPRNPQVGDLVSVLIDIQNLGSDPAPPFTYEWQGNIFDPASIVSRQVDGLAAGGVLNANLPVRFGWWGVFISDVRLDTQEVIVELSEQNNNRPFPVRTDNTKPFIIEFDAPLPNGDFVRGNQPMPFEVFVPWGFRVEVEIGDDPACRDAIPWFKYVGISRVALGTGLAIDPNQCADLPLIITFLNPRLDSNPSGISRAELQFASGAGLRTVEFYSVTDELLGRVAGLNTRSAGLNLNTGTHKIYRLRIASAGQPVNILGLTFHAP